MILTMTPRSERCTVSLGRERDAAVRLDCRPFPKFRRRLRQWQDPKRGKNPRLPEKSPANCSLKRSKPCTRKVPRQPCRFLRRHRQERTMALLQLRHLPLNTWRRLHQPPPQQHPSQELFHVLLNKFLRRRRHYLVNEDKLLLASRHRSCYGPMK